MYELLLRRYSSVLFDSTRDVTDEKLHIILQAGHLAPSCYNDQPWHFIICQKSKHAEGYDKILSTLVEYNQNWAKNAPVLLVAVASSKFSYKLKPNRWGQYDTGAAAFSMMLEATSLGLAAHQMGGFDEEKLRQLFEIPEDYIPMAVMAIGYTILSDIQPERKRKAINENFFYGKWESRKNEEKET